MIDEEHQREFGDNVAKGCIKAIIIVAVGILGIWIVIISIGYIHAK